MAIFICHVATCRELCDACRGRRSPLRIFGLALWLPAQRELKRYRACFAQRDRASLAQIS